jgi:hypothetical protein
MLQDKIDKIGGFRFTIKGWSVTAVIAGTITTSGKGLDIAFATSIGLLVMVFFFLLLESEQVRHSRLYGERAARLEDVFRRIAHGKGADMFHSVPVPYTAHDLVLAVLRKQSKKRSTRSSVKVKKMPELWRMMGALHVSFYLVLMLLSLIPLAAQCKAIASESKTILHRFHGAATPKPFTQPAVPKQSSSGK